MALRDRMVSRLFPLVVVVASAAGRPLLAQGTVRELIPPPGVSTIVTLPQNWTDDEARWFYSVAQGSKLIPYAWFLQLEQPDADMPFRAPAHLQALGYLPRAQDADLNPDGLPIGFVKDSAHLGLTCAACHTGLIRVGDKAWLIDGAPTAGDFERLQRRLVQALTQTRDDAARFQRFATRLDIGPSGEAMLRQQLNDVISLRTGYNQRNLPRSAALTFGPGRVDAFGAIMNEVAVTFAKVTGNDAPANAPVSYPCLWDTPQHDRVQWNGAAPNTTSFLLRPLVGTSEVGALGRNVGEVLGVFGTLDASSAGLTGLKGYPASANRKNLIAIEDSLHKLWSPQWPAALGAINQDDWTQGQVLFKKHCARCHDDTFDRTSATRVVVAKMDAVGTDPQMAANFATRTAKTGVVQDRWIILPGLRRFQAESSVSDLLTHMVQRAILGPDPGSATPTLLALTAPKFTIHAELRLDDQRRLVGEFTHLDMLGDKVKQLRSREALTLKQAGTLLMQDISAIERPGSFRDLAGRETPFHLGERPGTTVQPFPGGTQVSFAQPVAVAYAYKARPLNGVWATAPYLHNGSVPTLDELLKRPAQRVAKFKLGTREFDPVNVGFKNEGDFEFDTTQPGNSNAGHDYDRPFSDDERRQLIAYIKSL